MFRLTKVFWRKVLLWLGACFACLVFYALILDKVPIADPVEVGMSQEDVLREMGGPETVLDNLLARGKYGGVVWVYGPRYDFSKLMQLESPMIIRMFNARDGDLLVIYGSENEVIEVSYCDLNQ